MTQPEIKLPSGAILKITPGSFEESKTLYQALLSEMQKVRIDKPMLTYEDEAELTKNLFCIGFSSPVIEQALWVCFKRCTYNGVRIDASTFEPLEARGDYIEVCVEVVKVNVGPFAKSLFANWGLAQAMTGVTRK